MKERVNNPALGSLLATGPWVPHISLVFREMWETTALHRPVFHPTGKEHNGSPIPPSCCLRNSNTKLMG